MFARGEIASLISGVADPKWIFSASGSSGTSAGKPSDVFLVICTITAHLVGVVCAQGKEVAKWEDQGEGEGEGEGEGDRDVSSASGLSVGILERIGREPIVAASMCHGACAETRVEDRLCFRVQLKKDWVVAAPAIVRGCYVSRV
jgi:hypothetical protein